MAKKIIRQLSFARLATDEVFGMECRLAWQWTNGNAKYSDVLDVITGEDTFTVPSDKYSQKNVVPICEFKGAPYDVDGSKSIAKLRKEVDDIYGGTKGFLGRGAMLDDKTESYDFIDKLECIQNLRQLAKDKKPLPQSDPFKKGSTATQQPENQENTSTPPRRQAPQRQTTQQAASDDEGWFAQFVQNTEQEEAFDPQVALADIFWNMRPNFNFLAQFKEREDLAFALEDLGHDGREELFKDFKAEYDAVHAAMDAFDDAYAKYVKYIATAIVSFNKKDSVAYQHSSQAEAAQKAKNQQNGRRDGDQQSNGDQSQGNNNNQSQFQNKNQGAYIKRQKERLEKKILAAVKDNDGWWLSVYRMMQKYLEANDMDVFNAFRSTEKQIIDAEQKGDDANELYSMMEALVNEDFESYGNMKAQRDLGTGTGAGDDQQNGYSNNHSNNNTGSGQQGNEESQRILKQLEDLDAEAMNSGDIQRSAFIGRGFTAVMRGDLDFAKSVIWLDQKIQYAESEDGGDPNAELLGKMRDALYRWDTELYNSLFEQYEAASKQDDSNNQNAGDGSNNQGTGKLYSVNGILSWMEMLGVTSIPKALEFVPDHERDKEQITGQFINKYMEQIGCNARLPE